MHYAIGHPIGPWALLREPSQGGMASVWLAERADEPRKREVALKLPWLGACACPAAGASTVILVVTDDSVLSQGLARAVANVPDLGMSVAARSKRRVQP